MHPCDLIGDIHGRADELALLLARLGYRLADGCHRHPDGRRVIFLGDFIDRGPASRRVLEIVRPMVEAGTALAVMGNHEFNALCFHARHPVTGRPLREHSAKNIGQHRAFLDEYAGDEAALAETLAWLRTLPLVLELPGPGPRVVHACWSDRHVEAVRGLPWHGAGQPVPDTFLVAAATPGTAEHEVVEVLLKGPEHPLPPEVRCRDRDGAYRRHARICWWDGELTDPADRLLLPEKECRERFRRSGARVDLSAYPPYPTDAPAVFFGHYWRRREERTVGPNWACLDWSVARGGHLACYRWEADQPGRSLDPGRIVAVAALG